ncbi:hypothetical protein M8J75_006265 [Diaphorina citri]|nr:hypothetical protein M8J75_006265 [Diaphorina citri]
MTEEDTDVYSSRQSIKSSKSTKLVKTRAPKKSMVSNSANSCQDECSCEEAQTLREHNKKLQEKISLLQIQLQTQCRLHAVAHRRSSPHCQKRHPTASPSGTGGPQTSHLDSNDDKKRQLILMTEEMQAIHGKYEARIKELEAELNAKSSQLSSNDFTKVSDNVEIIKLRRLCKKQTAQLCTLQPHLEVVEKKLALYVQEYQGVSAENELLKERAEQLSQRISELELNHANKNAFEIHVKALEERIADLERERDELKRTVAQLNQIIDQQSENLIHNDVYRKRVEELEVLNNELIRELKEEKSHN